ncbi:hypothetical protein Tco_0930343 [Tanacetum coccineum]
MKTAKIDIIDSIDNDLEDVTLRYGPNAMAPENAGQQSRINILRGKYLGKILLMSSNLKKNKLMKAVQEEYWKKAGKKSKILTNTDVKVDGNLMEKFNEIV